MRACRSLMIAASLILLPWGFAQAAPPRALALQLPAMANSAGYRAQVQAARDAAKSPFLFKHGSDLAAHEPPPPRPMDQAVVMGKERPWLGGKPPLECKWTPLDPRCR